MMAARELSNIVRGGYSASAKAALRFPVGGGATLALASFVAVAGILLGTAAGLRGALRVQPLVSAQDA